MEPVYNTKNTDSHKVFFFFVFLALIRLLYMVTYSPNSGGGDSMNYFRMLLSGGSNLIHASGYPYLIGLPFRFLWSKHLLTTNQQWVLYYIVLVQHLISYCVLYFFFREISRYGRLLGCLTVFFLTVYHGMLQATSQIYPEWLQANLLIIMLILLHRTIVPDFSQNKKFFYFIAATAILAVNFLVKYNSIYWLVFLVLCLMLLKISVLKKVLVVFLAIITFTSIIYAYKRYVHFPSTGTTTLSYDKAWVLLDSLPNFIPHHALNPATGIYTKRLLLLNNLLPWDNQNVGAISNINSVSPDINIYRSKYLYLLTADEKQIDILLANIKTFRPFVFFTAFSPTTYYLGLAEGDQLGVDVFKENVRKYWKEYSSNIFRTTFKDLTRRDHGCIKIPLTLGENAKYLGRGFYKLDMSSVERHGRAMFYNDTYHVWKPGMFLFNVLLFFDNIMYTVIITFLLLIGFIISCYAILKKHEPYLLNYFVVILTIMSLGFVLFSNAICIFRSDKEVIALMPIVCFVLSKAIMDLFIMFKKLKSNITTL